MRAGAKHGGRRFEGAGDESRSFGGLSPSEIVGASAGGAAGMRPLAGADSRAEIGGRRLNLAEKRVRLLVRPKSVMTPQDFSSALKIQGSADRSAGGMN